jgi:micrococcal nuclease
VPARGKVSGVVMSGQPTRLNVGMITRVYDGDTVTCDLDIGFGIALKATKLRLKGIDTPELRGTSGDVKKRAYAARDYLRSLILGKEVLIRTHGKGKYGRWLATIYHERTDVNEHLIRKGHAQKYM